MKILNNKIKIINYFINSISIEDVLKYILNFSKKKKIKIYLYFECT